jgi:hypothetical protein
LEGKHFVDVADILCGIIQIGCNMQQHALNKMIE